MKPLSVLAVLLAVTGAAVALRGVFSHPVQAARAPETPSFLAHRPASPAARGGRGRLPSRGLLPASGTETKAPAAPTAERLPAPLREEPEQAPAVTASPQETIMVGPDGVIYRRSKTEDN
jgi:hypothetical protein